MFEVEKHVNETKAVICFIANLKGARIEKNGCIGLHLISPLGEG